MFHPVPPGSVSVVIPTRNRPDMVLAAVRSVLVQSQPPGEVIVVIDGPENRAEDSGTTEAMLARLDAAVLGPVKLHVLALPASVGGGEARNTGVRAASGAWIAFLDDDDLWMPEKLSAQLLFLEAAQNDQASGREWVLSCPVLAKGPHTEEVWPRVPYAPGQPMAEYLFCRHGWRYGSALLQTSTLLAPRALLLRLPFTPGLRKHQDWDWLLRAADDPAVAIHSVGKAPLVVFHVEGNRASVGRAPDWRHSVDWATTRRQYFSARALTAFLVTECAAQAQADTWRGRFALLRIMLRLGMPGDRRLLHLLVFLLVPQRLRRLVRDSLPTAKGNRRREVSSHGPGPVIAEP